MNQHEHETLKAATEEIRQAHVLVTSAHIKLSGVGHSGKSFTAKIKSKLLMLLKHLTQKNEPRHPEHRPGG